MEILLENIAKKLLSAALTQSQALYLIYTRNDKPFPIENDELLDLIEKGFIRANKVSKKMLTAQSVVNQDLKGTIIPKYELAISQEVTKKLCSLLCVVKPGTKEVLLPGGAGESIKYTADTYLQKEGLIAYHYIILLFLFPVAGTTNRRWEKHFTGFKYKGPKLRLRSRKNGAKFIGIAKKVDMGAFLYGTYLFIKSGVQANKTFIKSMPNYLTEYEDWYDEAYDILKECDDIEKLFKEDEDIQQGELNRAI